MAGIVTWRDKWDRFEAAVGLVAAFVLAFGPLTIASLALIFSVILAEWTVAAVAAAIVAVTGPMALWLARMAESAMGQFRIPLATPPTHFPGNEVLPRDLQRTRRSFALQLASNLPNLPWMARVPLSIWWLAHFAAGIALVELAEVWVGEKLIWSGLTHGLLAAVSGYTFHFAANIFLVLAVTALWNCQNATISVWRSRFAIDALCTVPVVLSIMLR